MYLYAAILKITAILNFKMLNLAFLILKLGCGDTTLPSWTINEQIISVLGLLITILDQNGSHLENASNFEFFSFKFGIARPPKPIPRAIA